MLSISFLFVGGLGFRGRSISCLCRLSSFLSQAKRKQKEEKKHNPHLLIPHLFNLTNLIIVTTLNLINLIVIIVII